MEQCLYRAPVHQSSPSIDDIEKLYLGLLGFGKAAAIEATTTEAATVFWLLSVDEVESMDAVAPSSLSGELSGDGIPAEADNVDVPYCDCGRVL